MFVNASTNTMKSARMIRALSASAARNSRGRTGCFPSASNNSVAARSVSHLVVGSSQPSSSRVFPAVGGSSNNHPLSLPLGFQQQQTRSIFIQSEDTPNPESVKFVPTGIVVLPDGDVNGYYVTKSDPAESILRSPLAKDLFKIDGIKAIYLGADFVTITKFAQTPWKMLRPQILDVLMNFFDTDTPALRDQPEIIDTTILDE